MLKYTDPFGFVSFLPGFDSFPLPLILFPPLVFALEGEANKAIEEDTSSFVYEGEANSPPSSRSESMTIILLLVFS
jgi:F0F1-type ATP synthase assembly protein I